MNMYAYEDVIILNLIQTKDRVSKLKWVVRNRTLRRFTDLKALPQYQFYSNKFLHNPYLNLCIKLISLISVNRWYAFALGPHCKRNMTPKYTILKSAIFIQFCVQRNQRGKPSMFIMYVGLKAFNDSYKRWWKAWYKPRRNSVIIHLRKKVDPSFRRIQLYTVFKLVVVQRSSD